MLHAYSREGHETKEGGTERGKEVEEEGRKCARERGGRERCDLRRNELIRNWRKAGGEVGRARRE